MTFEYELPILIVLGVRGVPLVPILIFVVAPAEVPILIIELVIPKLSAPAAIVHVPKSFTDPIYDDDTVIDASVVLVETGLAFNPNATEFKLVVKFVFIVLIEVGLVPA